MRNMRVVAAIFRISGFASIRRKPIASTIHIKLGQAKLRIEGGADPELVRVLLEYLARWGCRLRRRSGSQQV